MVFGCGNLEDNYDGLAAEKSGSGAGAENIKKGYVGLAIAKTLSPKAVHRLLTLAFARLNAEGAVMAGILMYLTGMRTSEACGVLYEDVIEVVPGYWAIRRCHLKNKNNDEITIGAKTENGYRLIPIPDILAMCINERRQYLEAAFAHEDIGKWPVACTGINYRKPADQVSVNRVMESLYKEAECDADLLTLASDEIRESAEINKECEGSLTAYLGRRQMITDMMTVGMPERYIHMVAGHADHDPSVEISDQTNPDVFVDISNYLNRRLIVLLLDPTLNQIPQCVVTPNTTITKTADGELEIVFASPDHKPIPFAITLTEIEYNDPISIAAEGIEYDHIIMPNSCPMEHSRISNAPLIRQMARRISNGEPLFAPSTDEVTALDGSIDNTVARPTQTPALPDEPEYRCGRKYPLGICMMACSTVLTTGAVSLR